MIFRPESVQAIREGRKTQTRRPMSPDDAVTLSAGGFLWRAARLWPGDGVGQVKRQGRSLWRVGATLSVCPGRGKNRVDLIRITAIRSEPLMAISEADAVAEGFADVDEFLTAWRGLYPKRVGTEHVWVLTFERVPR